jgi:hypothetical protein
VNLFVFMFCVSFWILINSVIFKVLEINIMIEKFKISLDGFSDNVQVGKDFINLSNFSNMTIHYVKIAVCPLFYSTSVL